MIKLGSTGGGEDTGLVGLECTLVGFDGDRDWSLSNGGGEGGVRVWGNVLE